MHDDAEYPRYVAPGQPEPVGLGPRLPLGHQRGRNANGEQGNQAEDQRELPAGERLTTPQNVPAERPTAKGTVPDSPGIPFPRSPVPPPHRRSFSRSSVNQCSAMTIIAPSSRSGTRREKRNRPSAATS